MTERLRVLNNGNVGIGKSNPNEKLEVSGKILADQAIRSNFASLSTIEGAWKAAMFYSEKHEKRGVLVIKYGYPYNRNSFIAFQPEGDYAKRTVLNKELGDQLRDQAEDFPGTGDRLTQIDQISES